VNIELKELCHHFCIMQCKQLISWQWLESSHSSVVSLNIKQQYHTSGKEHATAFCMHSEYLIQRSA